MEKLAELADGDSSIAMAIAKFFGEAAYNLFSMIIKASQKLPSEAHGSFPLIRLIEENASSESARELKTPGTCQPTARFASNHDCASRGTSKKSTRSSNLVRLGYETNHKNSP